jgi:hypothetical protein
VTVWRVLSRVLKRFSESCMIKVLFRPVAIMYPRIDKHKHTDRMSKLLTLGLRRRSGGRNSLRALVLNDDAHDWSSSNELWVKCARMV